MAKLYRLAGAYFLLQAAGVAAWWTLLWLRPEYRAYFQLDAASSASLLAFSLPDLTILAGGSVAASVCAARRDPRLSIALWIVAGSMSYATLYCLAGSVMTGRGWWGVVLMSPAMLVSVVLAAALTPGAETLLRQARPASAARNLSKTGVQVVLFWSTLLFLIPSLIAELQQRAGVPALDLPYQRPVAAALFAGFSALGLYSGYVMSRFGQGTPLPLDAPRSLVVRGPYAFVRNPMAIAGLGQGLCVSIYLGSVLVVAYVLLGSFLWQCVARPVEEDHLLKHFGADYDAYRRQVRCWCPRLKGFTG
jgi:protein-S-isoprenylcysteine O-methyltransferase Ste14